jgi:hypothetical protein
MPARSSSSSRHALSAMYPGFFGGFFGVFFTGVRGTCRKQFCFFWLPRAVDFKVSCSQIPRRAFAGIQTHDPLVASPTSWRTEWRNIPDRPGCRLPPTAVRMNHERLPRHCVHRATSSMTSGGQIWHILNIASSFSATLFWPNFFQ